MYPHPDLVNPFLSLDLWLHPPPPWALALELGVGWLPTSTFRLLRNDLWASFAFFSTEIYLEPRSHYEYILGLHSFRKHEGKYMFLQMLNQEAKVPSGIVEMSCQKELKAES